MENALNVLVLGAGRSASWLIDQLSQLAARGQIKLLVADLQPPKYLAGRDGVRSIQVSGRISEWIGEVVKEAHVAISLLPPSEHIEVAKACVAQGVNLMTASYETEAIRQLSDSFKAKRIFCLNEAGLDPGIDHITAHTAIDRLKAEGFVITTFESYCGGIPARQSRNAWDYIFFWNPMNVLNAGKDGALFREGGKNKILGYPQLFEQARLLEVENENFEVYANRDSLAYISLYGLNEVATFIRGTIRYEGFCSFWATVARAGLTNDRIELSPDSFANDAELINSLAIDIKSVSGQKIASLFRRDEIGERQALSSYFFQKLMHYWTAKPEDRDRVVMLHQMIVEKEGKKYRYTFSFDLEGNPQHSAMATTVGLPLYLMIECMLEDKTLPAGTITTSTKEVYTTLFPKLASWGLGVKETMVEIYV